MAFWLAFSRLLTILAVVSLVGVGASAAPAGAGLKVSGPAVTLSDTMACCDQPPLDCGDMKVCPSAILCVAKCPQSVPATAAVMVREARVAERVPYATQLGDGLPPPLPDHPPKA